MLRAEILKVGIVFGLLSSGLSYGQNSLEGLISVRGSFVNRHVNVKGQGAKDNFKLCQNETSKRISKLANMTLQIPGKWQGEGPARCFAATGFTVKKMSSGRAPVIGTLVKEKNVHQFKTDKGETYSMERVPAGMKSMLGKKILVDATLMRQPHGQESLKVISFIAYP